MDCADGETSGRLGRGLESLWRCVRRLPERGRIGIFSRSYYEESPVVRVHREFLEKQKLPPELVTKGI
jgi:polyphosphate kinase 2 (PPK2 family)